MSTAPPQLLTLKEFLQFPDRRAGRYELHHGELIHVPIPQIIHLILQNRTRQMISEASSSGFTTENFPYRPIEGDEFWIADVGYVPEAAWKTTSLDDQWFAGVPEIVVEVISPSDPAMEVGDREQTCLENGGKLFITINPMAREIKVTDTEFVTRTYRTGGVPLRPVLDGALVVEEMFAGLWSTPGQA